MTPWILHIFLLFTPFLPFKWENFCRLCRVKLSCLCQITLIGGGKWRIHSVCAVRPNANSESCEYGCLYTYVSCYIRMSCTLNSTLVKCAISFETALHYTYSNYAITIGSECWVMFRCIFIVIHLLESKAEYCICCFNRALKCWTGMHRD